MRPLHRSAIVIKPKRPFIKWANSVSGDGTEFIADYFIENHSCVVLMPEHNYKSQKVFSFINGVWESIFEESLRDWNLDTTQWPPQRTQKMFKQWFSVEFHLAVFDTK